MVDVASANWKEMHDGLEHEIRQMLLTRGVKEEEIATLRFGNGKCRN